MYINIYIYRLNPRSRRRFHCRNGRRATRGFAERLACPFPTWSQLSLVYIKYIYMYTYMCTYHTYVYIHIYICMHIYRYLYICVYMYMYMLTYTYVWYVYMYIYIIYIDRVHPWPTIQSPKWATRDSPLCRTLGEFSFSAASDESWPSLRGCKEAFRGLKLTLHPLTFTRDCHYQYCPLTD